MLKDYYVKFNEFVSQVKQTEVGILRTLIGNIFDNMVKTNSEYVNRYFLKYPFEASYAESCLRAYEIVPTNVHYQFKWLDNHRETAYNDEIPLFTSHYNLSEYLASRLEPFLISSISEEEYTVKGEELLIINQDRNAAITYKNGDYLKLLPPHFNPLEDVEPDPDIIIEGNFGFLNVHLYRDGHSVLNISSIDEDDFYGEIRESFTIGELTEKLNREFNFAIEDSIENEGNLAWGPWTEY